MTASASLPVIAVINCRSLQPKVRSLVEKFKNEDFSIVILCEIWEKTGKKNSFSSNWPTGPIQSSSRKVCPLVAELCRFLSLFMY